MVGREGQYREPSCYINVLPVRHMILTSQQVHLICLSQQQTLLLQILSSYQWTLTSILAIWNKWIFISRSLEYLCCHGDDLHILRSPECLCCHGDNLHISRTLEYLCCHSDDLYILIFWPIFIIQFEILMIFFVSFYCVVFLFCLCSSCVPYRCCQFLWIANFLLPLLNSLKFISWFYEWFFSLPIFWLYELKFCQMSTTRWKIRHTDWLTKRWVNIHIHLTISIWSYIYRNKHFEATNHFSNFLNIEQAPHPTKNLYTFFNS